MNVKKGWAINFIPNHNTTMLCELWYITLLRCHIRQSLPRRMLLCISFTSCFTALLRSYCSTSSSCTGNTINFSITASNDLTYLPCLGSLTYNVNSKVTSGQFDSLWLIRLKWSGSVYQIHAVPALTSFILMTSFSSTHSRFVCSAVAVCATAQTHLQVIFWHVPFPPVYFGVPIHNHNDNNNNI